MSLCGKGVLNMAELMTDFEGTKEVFRDASGTIVAYMLRVPSPAYLEKMAEWAAQNVIPKSKLDMLIDVLDSKNIVKKTELGVVEDGMAVIG